MLRAIQTSKHYQTLSNTIKHCQILSNTMKHHSNTIEYHQALLHYQILVEYYQTLWITFQILSSTIKRYQSHLQILFNIIKHYQVLSNTIKHFQALLNTIKHYLTPVGWSWDRGISYQQVIQTWQLTALCLWCVSLLEEVEQARQAEDARCCGGSCDFHSGISLQPPERQLLRAFFWRGPVQLVAATSCCHVGLVADVDLSDYKYHNCHASELRSFAPFPVLRQHTAVVLDDWVVDFWLLTLLLFLLDRLVPLRINLMCVVETVALLFFASCWDLLMPLCWMVNSVVTIPVLSPLTCAGFTYTVFVSGCTPCASDVSGLSPLSLRVATDEIRSYEERWEIFEVADGSATSIGKCDNPTKTIGKPWENGSWPFGKRLHNSGKSPCLLGKLKSSMAMFNSCVKLQECAWYFYSDVSRGILSMSVNQWGGEYNLEASVKETAWWI